MSTTAANLESGLEAFFRAAVRKAGGYTFKLAPTEAGIPDRLVVFPGGRIFLVELKTEEGRVSAIQSMWHNRIRHMGGHVYVLRGREQAAHWILRATAPRIPKRR